jgi:predicted DCC family thiol-disulfide oxidoreductase YuxK
MRPEKPVIFFDGVCGLCNRFVNYVFQHDGHHQFLFAPLQGELAKQLIANAPSGTVILWDQGRVLIKSEAALNILHGLGGWSGRVAKLGSLVPKILADFVYDQVAAHRYPIFGELDICRLPTPEEKPYFLD